jgi:hypothetical protein
VDQPIQIRLHSVDDQRAPLAYRYRIQGQNETWTETTHAEISFTLSSAGTYTFVAAAVDGEDQASSLVGSQITVAEREADSDSSQFPVEIVAAALGLLAVLFIGAAIQMIIRRQRRESW